MRTQQAFYTLHLILCSSGLDDLAGLQTAAADAQPLVAAAHLRLHRVKIHVPAPPRHVVRVRDVVSKLRAFAANITNLCHQDLRK